MAGRRSAAATAAPPIVSVPKPPATAAERVAARRPRITAAKGSGSHSLRLVLDALTAAAEVMPAAAPSSGQHRNNQATTWYNAVFNFRRTVPELNAGTMYVGNCLARVKLKVGKRNPDGSTEEAFDGA